MNPTKIDITKEFYAAAINSDWDKVEQYCHENFVIHESAALPYAGEYSGIDGFKQLVRKVFVDTFSEFEVIPEIYTENADYVMILIKIRGRGRMNDSEFTSELIEVVEFENNKIKTIKPFYWDQNLINKIAEY